MGRLRVGERAKGQVLGDRQAAEEPPPLGHERQTQPDALGSLEIADGPAGESDLSALRRHQPRDGLEERRLPGPVRADQRHDLAGVHGERDALEGQHAGTVRDLDAAHLQERAVAGRGRRRS